MKIKGLFFIGLLSASLISCTTEQAKDENAGLDSLKIQMMTQAQQLFQALPETAENPANVSTPEKIALGKKLYYDTQLSKNGSISCNSCHNLSTYGVDNLPTSPGADKKNGGRNSPTVLNAALHGSQFWDGRMKDVEEQAGGPVLNPIEMAMANEAAMVKKLKADASYKEMFKAAFPEAKDPITYENMRFAIAAFERTLLTPAPFDAFIKGDTNALTEQQLKGMKAFVDAGCQTCHNGNVLGGNMFMKFGIYGDYWTMTKSTVVDSGKVTVSKNPADLYVFKVMGLRNIEKTAPYFHDGSVADLKEAIKIMGKLELNKDLSQDEIDNIHAFMQSLTGTVPESALMK